MKSRCWINLLFILAIGLSGCSSSFASRVLAPSKVEVIDSVDDLPPSLLDTTIPWNGSMLTLDGSVVALPDDASGFIRIANNHQWITYQSAPLVAKNGQIPHVQDYYIVMYDLLTQNKRYLVKMHSSFPSAIAIEAPSFSPDDHYVIFWVGWEDDEDLSVVDIQTGEIRRLNVNITLTNFGMPDIASDGSIVAICQGATQGLISELCLLDSQGKFIRYLTTENYSWPGYGRFTPDGQYVVYESRFRLYIVKRDGTERHQIAPCSALFGPLAVTDNYAITACYISQDPDCYALFAARLDGNDFRRIGYIPPYCTTER